MEFTRGFSGLTKNDAAIAGGKGASLGEMTQAGIPVPPGFVILSGSFERFLEETDLNIEIAAILDTVNPEAMHTVEDASARIQDLILTARMPSDIATKIEEDFKALGAQFVAVRSSATAEDSASAAWAGQLDSFLNTTEATLLENVQRCWASLFTPRAIFYRFEKQLHKEKISVAVVVQKMVNSEAAGIAFSVHPVTEDYNQLIIEAGFGLGEAIVSGQVTPDSYVLTKEPRELIDVNVSDQSRALYRKNGGGNEWKELGTEGSTQVITNEQVLALAETVLGVEKHYGFPVDVEWAYEGGKFYIVQSRPITTLTNADISASQPKIVLSKIYSREKPLFYFSLWQVDDREATRMFLDTELKDDLFIVLPKGQQGSIWYSTLEFERLSELGLKKINGSKEFIRDIIAHSRKSWAQIYPYLAEGKRCATAEEMYAYYRGLVEFWYPMNSVLFTLPDRPDIDPDFKKEVLQLREETQEYTEEMPRVFLDFFTERFPDIAHLGYFVTPEETLALDTERDPELIATLEERAKSGCFMLEGVVYPYAKLEEVLAQHNLVLEKLDADGSKPLSGQPAYKGVVQGPVHLILRKEDAAGMKPGDVLITPMTNPDLVPIMKIAAAIVTDEGGATCHAAIASREMKIPCIVGTKTATQTFKNGDMVEVDADTGIIRSLTHKNGGPKYLNDGDVWMLAEEIPDIDFLFAQIWLSSFVHSLDPAVGLTYRKVLCVFDGYNLKFYLGFKDSERVSKEILRKIVEEGMGPMINERIILWSDRLQEISERITPEFLGSRSNAELIEFHRELDLVHTEFYEWCWLPNAVDMFHGHLTEYLRNLLLERSTSEQQANEALVALSFSERKSFAQDEEDSLIALALQKYDHPEDTEAFEQLLAKHHERFFYLKHLWIGKDGVSTLEEYRAAVDAVLAKGNPHEVLANEERKREADTALRDACEEKYHLTQTERELFRAYATFAYTKAYRRNVQLYWAYKMDDVAEEIARRLGISTMQARFITPDEVAQGLAEGFTEAFKDELAERTKHCVYYIEAEYEETAVGGACERYERTIRTTDEMHVDEIKGQIAYTGKVTGPVKVVNTVAEMHKVETGDILVSIATNPDILPAMKRAVAFVTEQGGITSHAAIVSREMQKPCIVGTKNATKVFKDGDMVEVDANTGIVRKL